MVQQSRKKKHNRTVRRPVKARCLMGGAPTTPEEGLITLDPELLLNCHLVMHHVRPAALFEPSDFGETTANDPKSAKILEFAKKEFSSILQTPTDFGVFLSLEPINGDLTNSAVRGKLLGYPCAEDDRDAVAISVETTFRSKRFGIFTNVAKDLTKLEQFKAFAAKAAAVIQQDEFLRANYGPTVIVTHRSLSTIVQLVNKILSAIPLTQDETQQYKDVISDSFGDSHRTLLKDFDKIVDIKNPVHLGIVLALLCEQLAHPWAPLYPIHDLPQNEEIKQGLNNQGLNLLAVLKETGSSLPAIRMAAATPPPKRTRKTPWR